MSGIHVYVDGYNFYSGINHPGWIKYGWCNFSKLAKRLTERAFGSSVVVNEVKYYTAPVRLGQESRRGETERQQLWLDAIRGETPEVKIIEGRFQKIGGDPRREKETDVNIAVDMQWDISRSQGIILVSGDSDFIPAIRAVKKAGLRAAVFLPPNQVRYRIPDDCPVFPVEEIKRDDLADCRLQEKIIVPGRPPILWSAYLNLRRQHGLSID